MKKALLVMMLALAVCGCEDTTRYSGAPVSDGSTNYRVVEIEGCEYLKCSTSHGFSVLTHKGNCKNPIHKK